MSSHSRLHDQMVMKWLKPYIHLEYPQKIFYTKNMSTFEGKNDDCKILGRIKILTNRCIVTEFLVIIGTIQLLILSFTMMMYHFEEYPDMTISMNIYSITSICRKLMIYLQLTKHANNSEPVYFIFSSWF